MVTFVETSLEKLIQINNIAIMADITYPEIAAQYDFYVKLLAERKSVFEDVIEVSGVDGNNKNFLAKDSIVKHISINDELVLIVNVRIANYQYFQFKLRCKKLSGVPFFRYDSDGETHRNYDDNIPLAEQQITTPHFHYFTKEGKCFAYKTDKLLEPREQKALEDIGICIAHFCDESNIRLGDNDYPEISITYGLGLQLIENDPLKNIQFTS
jgi:hypothetical protein